MYTLILYDKGYIYIYIYITILFIINSYIVYIESNYSNLLI